MSREAEKGTGLANSIWNRQREHEMMADLTPIWWIAMVFMAARPLFTASAIGYSRTSLEGRHRYRPR